VNKRHFLCGLSAALAAPAWARQPHPTTAAASPVLLTITGAVGKTNRGAFDKTVDILMAKHGASFERAYALDYAAIMRLAARTITATLEYDSKSHRLRGPLLTDVLNAAGVSAASAQLHFRAVDGYSPTLSLADARKYGFIIASHADGRPLALGGLGPLWAVYSPDRFPETMAKPLPERFAACPWGVYLVDVRRG
jgi:hypothetical protein